VFFSWFKVILTCMRENITEVDNKMGNRLILGDNLQVLKNMPSESVDLCYIDPPFFSNRNYEVIWGDEGEVASFTDRWSGGIDHYIGWLKERIEEIWRVLKPNGNLCVHCDWHADAYIRVHILDKLGGKFVNEIVWKRANAHNDAKKKFAILTDTVFCYAKSDKYTYNPTYEKLSEKYVEDFYKYKDERGIYRLGDLTGAGINKNDKEWKGYHPSKIGRSWSVSRDTVRMLAGDDGLKLSTIEKLELFEENGFIEWSRNGTPRFKGYLDKSKGILLGNLWIDIGAIASQSKERIGYPTQKPLALMDRIIKAFSNEGNVVLDAFCGGGTTLVAAQRLKRKFIGIDQSVRAITVSRGRIEKESDLFSPPFTVERYKYNRNSLINMDAFKFEQFIIEQFGGEPNVKQIGDRGRDGIKRENGIAVPIQVKRRDGVGRPDLQKFVGHLVSANVNRGYFIAFSYAKNAYEYVAGLKLKQNIEIELVKVEEIVPLSMPPNISLSYEWRDVGKNHDKEIAFTATGDDIEIWQWDWDYDDKVGFKGEVLMDKTGRQTRVFHGGSYEIAVRGVNKECTNAVEVLHLVVNGGVQQSGHIVHGS
jgi:DNA modification methylase